MISDLLCNKIDISLLIISKELSKASEVSGGSIVYEIEERSTVAEDPWVLSLDLLAKCPEHCAQFMLHVAILNRESLISVAG